MPILFILFSIAGLLLVPSRAQAELAAVWAVDDGTKIKQTDLRHPLQQGNGIFSAQQRRIRLFGLRNEIVSFQLILQGGNRATRNVRVVLDHLGAIKNGAVTDDPDTYYLHRNIEIFEERYLQVRELSGDTQPAYFLGPVPDPLVPLRRPLTIPPGLNQGLWFDIYIPPETRPGKHQGELVIEADGQGGRRFSVRLAVELEVLQHTLPDRPTLKTMLFFSGSLRDSDNMLARYLVRPAEATPDQVATLRARHFKTSRRHRITLFCGIDEDQPSTALEDRLSGQAFSPAAGYYGPGAGIGQDMYSIHTYGGKLTAAEAQQWSRWLSAHAPRADYFLYTLDEPGDASLFAKINRIAREARPVPSLVTARWQPGLTVDIYVTAPSQYSPRQVRQAQAKGKRVWIYNGHQPFCGTFLTDDYAIATRVNPWIQHKYKIPRWFFWESTYYNDFQGGRGQTNVLRDALTFSNRAGDRLNGDGVLFYPGRDRLFPGQSWGRDLPLPSIRLKNWRRGIQDVEYLALVEKQGHSRWVQELIQTLIPRALADETSEDQLPSWPTDGETWLEARRLLFLTLKRGHHPSFDLRQLMRPPEPLPAKIFRYLHRTMRSKKKLAAVSGALLLALAAGFYWRRRQRQRL